MTTITIRISAKSALIRERNPGFEVLASIRLDILADALNAMEHNDTDPGERRMNADQCRDALLREVLHSWTPAELVEAKIPAVLELADQVATLTRERGDARAHLLGKGRECDSLYHDIQEAARTGVLPAYAYPHEPSTTPTPGAQA